MTNEQKIKIIKARRDKLLDSTPNKLDGDVETLNMAIKAIEFSDKLAEVRIKRIAEMQKRYRQFVLMDNPAPFCNTPLFSEKYECIQIHDVTPVGEDDIIGFAGRCRIRDGKLVSLDGDSYSPEMIVFGYKEFENENGICLDLLVDEW